MKAIIQFIKELFAGVFGYSCPECKVRPLKPHRSNCSIGKWDGGTWA